MKLVARFLPAVGATVILVLVVATRPLAALPRGIAIACVVGAWVGAVVFRRKEVRTHASVVAGIAAVTSCGQVDAGLPYGVGCFLFLCACLFSMRAARASEVRVPRRGRSELVLAIAGVAITTSLLVALPPMAKYAERKLDAMFGGDGIESTAFSTAMVLGSTRGMLQSSKIVLRIDGERPDYLRGAVYNQYTPPHWVTTDRGRERTSVPATPVGAKASQITLARGAPNGQDMRWFVPPRACDLTVASGTLEIDAFGIARRGRGEEPQALQYRTASCTRPPVLPAPPDADDLGLPPSVKRLRPIAARWTASATTPREKLDAIQRELGRFEYSLAVERNVELDSVVDFVTVHRAGHCEMFASAMVLMARAEGIPARVVGGYRVSEVNPLTGRTVVRERNAHAWVEAWVDGAWREWDPTPAVEGAGRGPGRLENVGDVLASALDVVITTITKLGMLGVAGILAAIALVLLFVRWLGTQVEARRGRRRRTGASALPLPCFDALATELGRAGHPRGEWEPLEDFARRIATDSAPWAHEVSQALREYAGLRYGGIGDEADVVRLVERATRSVRPR